MPGPAKSKELVRSFKRKCFWEYYAVTWTMLYFKVLDSFLKTFLYLKNNNSVEHVQKVLLILLFIYFQGKIKF